MRRKQPKNSEHKEAKAAAFSEHVQEHKLSEKLSRYQDFNADCDAFGVFKILWILSCESCFVS